jgi:hypothetical protein
MFRHLLRPAGERYALQPAGLAPVQPKPQLGGFDQMCGLEPLAGFLTHHELRCHEVGEQLRAGLKIEFEKPVHCGWSEWIGNLATDSPMDNPTGSAKTLKDSADPLNPRKRPVRTALTPTGVARSKCTETSPGNANDVSHQSFGD